MKFRILGSLEIVGPDKPVELGGAKRRGLLAYLLVHAGQPVSLDRLVEDLWDGGPSSGAAGTVQTYLSQLRKVLAGVGVEIETRPGGYALVVATEELDAAHFERLCADATADPAATSRLARLDEALALWRGAPLEEFAGSAWAVAEATRLEALHLHAVQQRFDVLLALGRHHEVIPELEVVVGDHSLDERFSAQLMLAYYRAGRQADALRAYQRLRTTLADELGIDPSAEVAELERRILDQDPELMPARPALQLAATDEPLPEGTVTFLFTDLESSTRLWEEHPEAMKAALARHDAILRKAVEAHGGYVVKTTGDGVVAVFTAARDAIGAGVAGQRALAAETWGVTGPLRVRMGIHSGEAEHRAGDYYGTALNRAARLTSVASGGQIVVSQATADLLIDDLPGIGLVDLGEHDLRGLRRRETLYLVTAPGLDVSAPLHRQPDVPVGPRNSLVGRVDALAQLEAALARPGLVTVVGPGGIGKTRLLHEVAGRLRDQFSRTWIVDLVGARDGAAVESALQSALLFRRATMTAPPDIPDEDVTTQVASAVGSRRVLLAFDNCEQVADAVAAILTRLLACCRGLSVLATSREPLAVADGRVVPLGPLELPAVGAEVDVDALGDVESVRLVLDRVRDAGGELRVTPATAEPLVQICVQVDGIPLALELAAARLTTTTPTELRDRLSRQLDVLKGRSHDPRHQTLHRAIDWSYQLLDQSEQTLLRRLGVFIGGFSLDAAEEVCCDTNDELLATADDVYLNLAELVAKSLVVFEPDKSRYRLLEPIRLFAHEQLERTPEDDALSRRHARWILRYSRETLAAVLTGDNAAVVRFSPDLDNAHSALAWLHRTGDNKTYLQIVAALGYIWFQTDWRRGRAATAIAVELATTSSPRLRAAVLLSRGLVEQRAFNGFYDSAPWLTEARSIYGTIGDTLGLAWTTFFLARATKWDTEHPDRTSTLFLEAAALFRELNLPTGEAWSLVNLAGEARAWGDLDLSQRYLEQALKTTHTAGLTWVKANVLTELAVTTLDRGDIERARSLVREGIELQRPFGDAWNLTGMLAQAGQIEIAADRFDAAEAFLKDALHTGIASDDEWQLAQGLLCLAVVSFKQADYRRARELVAATGWDLDPPHVESHPNSGIARALDLLRPICTERYEESARDGRARGVLATARAVVSA